jgi:hypothetical protein
MDGLFCASSRLANRNLWALTLAIVSSCTQFRSLGPLVDDLLVKELLECLFWFFVCSRSYVWELTAYSVIVVIWVRKLSPLKTTVILPIQWLQLCLGPKRIKKLSSESTTISRMGCASDFFLLFRFLLWFINQNEVACSDMVLRYYVSSD